MSSLSSFSCIDMITSNPKFIPITIPIPSVITRKKSVSFSPSPSSVCAIFARPPLASGNRNCCCSTSSMTVPSPSTSYSSRRTRRSSGRVMISCDVDLRSSNSTAAVMAVREDGSDSEAEIKNKIGARVRVKVPIKVYHVNRVAPELDLNGMEGSIKQYAGLWKGKRISANLPQIDMVQNKHGIYTSKRNKVVVLWDLDNKPPRGEPYLAALALKQFAQKFGDIIDFSAYANRHAFSHLPQWVLHERRERKQLDILERKRVIVPEQPYICGVCGRKCKTNMDLKKHFRQLHERERQKKLNRMKSLKGKKRQKFKERYISGNEKYNEEARRLVTPKLGYRLDAELRRAGVYVKTVEDKPQAADWAVKRQIEHSVSRGVDWLVLVSDDSDFSEILRKVKEEGLLGTVVVGDRGRALGRHADIWVPWSGVENEELREQDLVRKRRNMGDGFYSVSEFDGDGSDLVSIFGEVDGVNVSAFSAGEEEEEEEEEDYLLWDSEDDEEEDGEFDLTDVS